VRELREMAAKVNPSLLIEIDGGMSTETIKSAVEAGVDVVVAGSAVYRNGEIAKNITALKDALK